MERNWHYPFRKRSKRVYLEENMVSLKKEMLKTKKAAKGKEEKPAPKQKKQKGYVRRALKKMEPKINENPKGAMFIRSTTASQKVMDIMKDLVGGCVQVDYVLVPPEEASWKNAVQEKQYSSL